jgi:hypothetical protein
MSPISRIDEIKFVQLKTCCGNAQGASVYYALRCKCVLAISLRILNIVTGRHNLLRWQNLGEIRLSGAASLTRLATGCSLSPSSRATERIRAHHTQFEIISRAGNGPWFAVVGNVAFNMPQLARPPKMWRAYTWGCVAGATGPRLHAIALFEGNGTDTRASNAIGDHFTCRERAPDLRSSATFHRRDFTTCSGKQRTLLPPVGGAAGSPGSGASKTRRSPGMIRNHGHGRADTVGSRKRVAEAKSHPT